MNGIERIKLIGKLVQLNKTVPGASPVERIKGIGQIITIVKQLGGTVNAGGAEAGPLVIHSDDELIKLWREKKVDYIAAGNKYLSKNYSFFAAINPSGESAAFKYDHGSKWWKWIASDGKVVSCGFVAVSEAIYAFCKAKTNGGEVRKLEHAGGPYAEDLSLENNFPAIKSNKDFVKFYDENDCEVLWSTDPEIKHLENYLRSSGQTHFECENWVNREGSRDGGSGIILTTVKVKEKQVWDFNGKDWYCYLDVDETDPWRGDEERAVAAFAEGVRNGTLKVINATPNKPINPEWAKDRETLQSIIDGAHPDMKLPVLYDALAGINERQKDNPEYPEMLERALDEWQAVVMDMTAKIIA